MIRTSNFFNYKKEGGVSIALGTPSWYEGPSYPTLYPSWDMIMDYKKDKDWAKYEARYRQEVLAHLDPVKVAKDLEGKVLLCWEKPGVPCHRRIVAAWLLEYTGHPVTEI